jgi:hypothetical protein
MVGMTLASHSPPATSQISIFTPNAGSPSWGSELPRRAISLAENGTQYLEKTARIRKTVILLRRIYNAVNDQCSYNVGLTVETTFAYIAHIAVSGTLDFL